MKLRCKTCGYEITEYQNKEYDGCCCGVCENKVIKELREISLYCANCGLPLTEEQRKVFIQFCDGGCAGEYEENLRF